MARRSEVERFMSHVDKTETCWLWTAYRLPRGYGLFRQSHGHELAHREAHRMFIGPIPAGQNVMHSCDNPPCVNPAHLSLGTQTDNMRDAKRKCRTATGESHGRSKLTAADVEFARASPLYQREVAALLGVSQGHISAIRSVKRWAPTQLEA